MKRQVGREKSTHVAASESYFRDAAMAADGARELAKMGRCGEAMKYLRHFERDRESGYRHLKSAGVRPSESLASRNASSLAREAFAAFKRRCVKR